MNVCGVEINRVLIYKRTHPGDPRSEGVFGVENCMGSHREYDFDAVIGIGGRTCTKSSFKPMRERLNWVGVVAHKEPTNFSKKYTDSVGRRYSSLITFDYFQIFEKGNGKSYSCNGEIIEDVYPAFYRFAYEIPIGNKKPYGQSLPIIELNDKSHKELNFEIVKILTNAISDGTKMPHYTIDELESFIKKCSCGKKKTKCSC